MNKTLVVTYQAPSGETIDLTLRQITMLKTNGVWPRTSRGAEYCSVSHGQHHGTPTFSKENFRVAYDTMRFHKRNARLPS